MSSPQAHAVREYPPVVGAVTAASVGERPERIVSLVPSLTELVALIGAADRLVGVTDWCVHGVPVGSRRVGGTKTPSRRDVVLLRPDLVLANAEENRAEDIAWLRDRGVPTLVTLPRRVADVPVLIRAVDRAVGGAGEALARAVEQELTDAVPQRLKVRAVMLVWRRPWIAAGPDTYSSDLMERAGLVNALADVVSPSARWPRVGEAEVRAAAPDVVVLPTEPYAFGSDDFPAVAELSGGAPARVVDGQAVTWHGPRAAEGLRQLRAIAHGWRAEEQARGSAEDPRREEEP